MRQCVCTLMEKWDNAYAMQLSKYQNIKMPKYQNAKIPKCQNAKMPKCQNVKMPKCQNAKNVTMPKCHFLTLKWVVPLNLPGEQMSKCQNAKISKCRPKFQNAKNAKMPFSHFQASGLSRSPRWALRMTPPSSARWGAARGIPRSCQGKPRSSLLDH